MQAIIQSNRRIRIGTQGEPMKSSFFAVLLMLLAGCSQAPHDTSADAQALKDNEVRWNQEYAAKDFDKIVAHYTDDATLMAPGAPPASGRTAIQGVLKSMLADPALSLKFQASRVEVASAGDVGWTQGSYQMTLTDPATNKVVHDAGSYVTTYKKQSDGSWKAVSDIATSGPAPKS